MLVSVLREKLSFRSFSCPLLYWGIIPVWEAEVNCVLGQGICCTVTFWGNVKSIVFESDLGLTMLWTAVWG